MTKRTSLSLLAFFIPVAALLALITLRKNKASDEPLAVPAGKSIPRYVEQEKSWMTNQYDAISALSSDDFSEKIRHLAVDSKAAVSDPMMAGFKTSLSKTLMSFRSEQFNDFLNWASIDERYSFDTNFIAGFGETIEKEYGKRPATAHLVVEAWWSTNSVAGSWGSKICQGICWNQSFLHVEELGTRVALDPRSFNNYLMDAVPNCGVVSTTSIFAYSPRPEDVLSANGKVLIADAYLLFKFEFNHETVASPLILRYYWAPAREKWLPYLIAWAYQGTVPCPVF